ncbi:MAG: MAPEG family protein [Phycisphaerales bacterium]|nr:MAPEG family protein [Phycisphaerales bacterium]
MPSFAPAFKVYALTSAIIVLQLLVLAGWTGAIRTMRKTFVNPEDAKLNKGEQVDVDHPDVQRVKRAHQNLLENAVPFFAIGLCFALTKPSVTSAQAYLWTFVGARVLHSVFYLWGKQPFRTLTFAVGVASTIGMAYHVIRAVM